VLRLYYGPDSYTRAAALAALRGELDGDGMLSANTAIFDGRSVKPEELMSACDTVPFLAERRFVLVEGLLSAQETAPRTTRPGRPRSQAGSADDKWPWAGLAAYARRLPESTELVCVDGELQVNNRLLAELRPLADVNVFPLMDREALSRWVSERVRERRASIQPRAAAVLAETVGANLWRMNSEVEKLCLFAYDRPIEVADVRQMVTVAPTGTVFQLVDAAMAGQSGEALRLVRLLMEGGAAGPYLLTMLARQYRQLLLAQDLLRRRVSRDEIQRKLELRYPGAMAKVMDQARRYPAARLESGYARLLEADLNIKRGIQDEETAIELLVAELAGLR